MNFEVIQAVGKEGQPIEKDLTIKLDAFRSQKKIKQILFMTQSSFLMKTGTPVTLLTICYEESAEPRISRL